LNIKDEIVYLQRRELIKEEKGARGVMVWGVPHHTRRTFSDPLLSQGNITSDVKGHLLLLLQTSTVVGYASGLRLVLQAHGCGLGDEE